MQNPTIVVIGAGALGGVLTGALLRAGEDVSIIDVDAEHVGVINANGLKVAGLDDEARPIKAVTGTDAAHWADVALVMTPAYATHEGAATAQQVLKPGGMAVSMQNGLGNYEALVEALGADRVFMGSTKMSADRIGPGCPRITRLDPSHVGELVGASQPRTRWFAEALTRGGLPTDVSDNILGVMWSKFLHNCCINAPSAITGLTMGEVTRTADLDWLRWQVLEEGLAVALAKGITLADPDPKPVLQKHTWRKFTKPSMLQHIEQLRPIEIEAINGWLVREGDRLGVPVPLNRAVTGLARGRAEAMRQRGEGAPDLGAMSAQAEAEIDAGMTPWDKLG